MALGILAICITAIMGLMPVALNAVRNTLDIGARQRMLQATKGELLNLPYSSLVGDTIKYSFDVDGRLLDPTQMTTELFDKLHHFQVEVVVTGSATIPFDTTTKNLAIVRITGSNIITHQTFKDQFHLPHNGY